MTGRVLTIDPVKDGSNWNVYCDSDPIGRIDPAGLALIYLGWREVGGGGHPAYIVIVDEATGETWTIGGGLSGNHGTGILQNESGPANHGSYSGNYESIGRGVPSAGNHRQIKDDDRPGKWWFDKLNGIGEEIESKGDKYGFLDHSGGATIIIPWIGPPVAAWGTGSNSNAFTSTVVKRGGLSDEAAGAGIPLNGWPGGSLYAPGWGRIIPR